jgi:hypothetical protein
MTQLTTTWTVNYLTRRLSDGWVFFAEFNVTATKDDTTVSTKGSVTFKQPDDLIPYEELTEETVLEWIKTELNDVPGADAVINIENELHKRIEMALNPTEATGLPW